MRRRLCLHAGTSITRLDPARGPLRTCAKGVARGEVSRDTECERCRRWEDRPPAATDAAGAGEAPPDPPPRPARKALPVLDTCRHEGAVIVPCHSCGAEARHVRDCAVHGTCTRADVGKDVEMSCARCRREGLGFAAGPA